MDSSPSMELHLGSFLCLRLLPFVTRRNNDSGSRLSQSAGLRPFPTRPVMYNEEHTVSDYADSSRVNSYTSPLYSDRPLYSDPPMFSSPLPGFGDHSVGVFPDASPMYSDPSSAPLFSDASSPLFADHTSASAWTSMHSSWTPRESLLPPARPLLASPFPPKRPESSPFPLKHTLSAESSEFVPKKADYSIDIEKVRRGEDKRTTLMVRNIPNG